MDGLIPVPELKDRLEIKELPEEDRGRYNTLAGMIMLLLGRLPRTADTVLWEGWRFEVVDLDGKRVDKVLATRTETPGEDS
jgi:putative hemolysin